VVSLTAEYALRAVSYLAVEHDRPRTVHQIAEATQVPPDYLSKVLQELSRLGLVRSQRGLYGGFTLVREPPRLTVLEVVRAVSPLQRIEDCPLHREGHGPGRLCPLHRLLDDASAYIERSFGSATIADLVRPDGEPRVLGLCEDSERTGRNEPVKKQP
jgi:Rrf2 family nitric oxide-sensitive transcriptional repressor